MGLDLYVGSLTRYYAGDWELVTQTAARELGLELQVIRQHNPTDAIRDPEELRPIIIAWRNSLSESLADNLNGPLDWDEADDSPYFTDKPTWDCYGDLLLWAAYDEQPHLLKPAPSVNDWGEDPAYKLSSDDRFPSLYSNLYGVELWLPCPFRFVFEAEDMGGNLTRVGSSVELARQLEALNERTWMADHDRLRNWRRDGSEHGAPLESGARFAFSVFHDLAKQSVEHRLPMRLDY